MTERIPMMLCSTVALSMMQPSQISERSMWVDRTMLAGRKRGWV